MWDPCRKLKHHISLRRVLVAAGAFLAILNVFYLSCQVTTQYNKPTQAPVIQECPSEIVSTCNCVVEFAWGGSQTIEQFDLMLSWMNMTTKEHLVKRHPNLPVDFLYQASNSNACHLVPTISGIGWRNVYWQEASLEGPTAVLLYSAFYDPNPGGAGRSVRLLALMKTFHLPSAWCRFWYAPDRPPFVVKVAFVDYLDYQRKDSSRQMPFLITCPLPAEAPEDQPVAVSLVQKPCEPATTLLQVVGSQKREASAHRDGEALQDPASTVKGWVPAVCGPALYYYHNDFSKRIVEWLEILRAQGFGRVFLHLTQVHPNVQKVLQHYEREGFLQVTHYAYPPPYVNEPSLRRLWTLVERSQMFAQENIYFTDCVLRHMHQYRFIAHYDPDEVPILLKHDNYTHFLDDLLANSSLYTEPQEMGRKPAGYRLKWRVHYDNLEPRGDVAELPEYLWALRHTRRSTNDLPYPNDNYKTLYDMDIVRGVFSHGPVMCTTGWCYTEAMLSVQSQVAYTGHFSKICGSMCDVQNHTKDEPFLLRYKEPVATAVTKVLKQLELL